MHSKSENLKIWWAELISQGQKECYYVNGEKSWITLKSKAELKLLRKKSVTWVLRLAVTLFVRNMPVMK